MSKKIIFIIRALVINSSPEDKINNDDVDSEKGENEFVVFKNVLNENLT